MKKFFLDHSVFLFLNRITKPNRKLLIYIFAIGCYSTFHSIIEPYAFKILIDSVSTNITSKTPKEINTPVVIIISMSFFILIAWRSRNYVSAKFFPLLKGEILSITLKNLKNKPYSFFQNNLTGELSTKVNDLLINSVNLINNLLMMFMQFTILTLSVIIAGTTNILFSFFFTTIITVFIVISYIFSKKINSYIIDYTDYRAINFGKVVDSLSNIFEIKIFAREDFELKQMEINTSKLIKKDQRMQLIATYNAIFLSLISFIIEIITILALVWLCTRNLVSAGDFAFIILISKKIIDQVWMFSDSILKLSEQINICRNSLNIFEKSNYQYFENDIKPLVISNGNILLKNITFKYNSEKAIFEDLNLKITGGTKVGIIGFSGQGKSTLTNLMTRIYETESGKILIDNQDISGVTVKSLRQQITIIPQNPNLFHRTILSNIQYGNLHASFEEVVRAAKIAHAHEFIQKLDKGYLATVGDKGLKLSRGQKQRIVIARAILKDSKIFILDEATSSLDKITEKKVQKSLFKLLKNKTIIVIAHKLEIMKEMDLIHIVNEGKIVASGTHINLLKFNHYYKSLWQREHGDLRTKH
ncbi:MAG: ABC transporter ATP-binding protein [Pseudomonadota bacterium]|nr:ABC transporter ATP-binding protein [Pseudomonadota bacterium]